MKGFIYILLNPLFPTYLKIGKTTKPSEERAKEIYRKARTGIPSEYIVAYDVEVSNCDLVEKLVHQALEKKRLNTEREFFFLSLKEAVKTVEKITNELSKLQKIELIHHSDEPFSNKKWWSGLSLAWKQIFKSYLLIQYKPIEIDILSAIHSIIDNSQDEKLRLVVTSFLADKNYLKRLLPWYQSLGIEKTKFNSYLPYELSTKEIEEILNLKQINCQNHLAVLDLKPLSELKFIEKINCTNTSIGSLEGLNTLRSLKEVTCNFTAVETLEPLTGLEKLEKIICYGTKIAEQHIVDFKKSMPNCEVVTETFLQNFTNSGTSKKNR